MRKILFLLCFAPLLMASTCENDDDQIFCTQEFVYGLNVNVIDATTGQPIVQDMDVRAVDGSYMEILYRTSDLSNTFLGAGERMGSYTITVTKVGYQTYISTPLVVTANVCHVNPQSLTISLQPE